MILQDAEQLAYILLDSGAKTLHVTVRRPYGKRGAVTLLSTCADVVAALCSKWYSLEMKKFVVCGHCINSSGVAEQHLFPAADVELAAAKGANSLHCPVKNGDVELRKMLPELAASNPLLVPAADLVIGAEINRVRRSCGRAGSAGVLTGAIAREHLASCTRALCAASWWLSRSLAAWRRRTSTLSCKRHASWVAWPSDLTRLRLASCRHSSTGTFSH